MSANKVQTLNALLCPPLGFGLNFLLLWFILRRTPKEMMVHSRVLLQTCLMDCLLLVLQTVGQQIIIYEQGFQPIAFYDGYMIRLFRTTFQQPHPLVILGLLWLFSYNVSIFGISIQFLYRYLVLTRNKNVTLCHYLLMLAGPTFCTGIISLGLCYDLYQTFVVSPLHISNAENAHYTSIIDFDQQPLFATAEFNDLSVITHLLFAFMYACSYTVIFFCGWKMVRFLSQHATLNAQLKELNRQLTRNLILLATFPLMLQFIGILVLANKNYQIISVETSFYTFLTLHWLPVLNPVASILTNRPYREAVISKLRLCSRCTTTVTPIAANVLP